MTTPLTDPPGPEAPTARPRDRRLAPRYAPARDATQLGWWEDGQFRTADARLRNISSGGAAVNLGGTGPDTAGAWVCILMPGTDVWVQASVAGAVAAEDGTPHVRLTFAEPCPDDVLISAVGDDIPAPADGTEAPATGSEAPLVLGRVVVD